jgi:hypothetical protein
MQLVVIPGLKKEKTLAKDQNFYSNIEVSITFGNFQFYYKNQFASLLK